MAINQFEMIRKYHYHLPQHLPFHTHTLLAMKSSALLLIETSPGSGIAFSGNIYTNFGRSSIWAAQTPHPHQILGSVSCQVKTFSGNLGVKTMATWGPEGSQADLGEFDPPNGCRGINSNIPPFYHSSWKLIIKNDLIRKIVLYFISFQKLTFRLWKSWFLSGTT